MDTDRNTQTTTSEDTYEFIPTLSGYNVLRHTDTGRKLIGSVDKVSLGICLKDFTKRHGINPGRVYWRRVDERMYVFGDRGV
jgi:hypothetical protein